MSDIPDRLRSRVFFECYTSEFNLEDSLGYQAAAEIERLEKEVDNATQVNAELLIDLPDRLEGALIGVIAAYDSLYREGEDADIDDRLRVRWERRVNASVDIARRALDKED
ncbi:hypothetical protein LCGC14_0344330 [marine sediment metagenome]|uniref:Uncharacterized protein n=1 Tax=marine sediment metagenome TaxID=412755 RepID=A0A0F9TVH1_9ZZZZ